MDEGNDVPAPPPQAYPPQPPPGSYPPPPAYPPPVGGHPPPGYPVGYGAPGPPAGWTSSDDRTWALLAHLSFFVLSIIGPLVIMLTKGKESPFVRDQAVEALNFHITFIIAMVVSTILIFVVIGIFTMLAAGICGVVFTIMAAVAANQGRTYRYPVNLRLVH